MKIRASLLPCLLALAGCPSDLPSEDGTESATTTGSTGPTTATGPSTTMVADTTEGMTTTVSTSTGPGTDTDEPTGTTTGGPIVCPYEEVEGRPAVALELVADGFDRPVHAVGHPTEIDRLFVVEQGGDVRILEPGQTSAPGSSFLHVDVQGAGNTSIGAEFGLLGFAFHPDFPADPRVYVNYNPAVPPMTPIHTVVSEFTLDPADSNQVDPTSERVIIELHQPANNHNGGMIQFDSEGYLLIGMGDGGQGGDAFDTGRDPSMVHAKILRIGVEPDGSDDDPTACMGCPQYGPFDYTIPPTNPFVGDAAFAPEVYVWGVRNPWRFSIDPETDLLYVADVGQNQWEEVSLAASGADLGWSDMEGFHCFGGAPCDTTAGPNEVNADGLTMPLVEYNHQNGRCSITGGSVYRSCEVPAWDGVYFYGDFCTGELFALSWDGAVTDLGVVLDQNELPLGNGWNAYGDVFITTVDAILGGPIFDGKVYRIAPGA
ncbi:PQQ-dependent sugar dehydrogenase [Paraliomyxa miuraensis]|nr:PQQ-dependent sugar dehydrogenase [Paraliomyxa miuraensis]